MYSSKLVQSSVFTHTHTHTPSPSFFSDPQGHTKTVWCLAALPRMRLASGAFDSTVRIWDTVAGLCTSVLKADEGCRIVSLAALSLHGTGNILVSGSEGGRRDDGSSRGMICVWDTDAGRCLRAFGDGSKSVCSLVVCPGRPKVTVAAAHENHIRLWQ